MIIKLIKTVTGVLCLLVLFRVLIFMALNWEKTGLEILIQNLPEVILIVVLLFFSMIADTHLENNKKQKL